MFDIQRCLAHTPTEPGVYLMRNHQGEIIYIGKAVNLRARVASYFRGGDPRGFVKYLPRILSDIQTVVTGCEASALRLEASLLRSHKPRYNVVLGPKRVWLRIDIHARWPRVDRVWRFRSDGARYFEFFSNKRASAVMRLLSRHFHLRTCDDTELRNRSRPCIEYQIGRCPAPCSGKLRPEQYRTHVDDAILFLEGRHDELAQQLEDRMWGASDTLHYEVAARYRDQVRAVLVASPKRTTASEMLDRDVVGMHREADRVTFQVVTLRDGRARRADEFHFTGQEFPDEELLSSFLTQYYAVGREIPAEVLVPSELEAHRGLEQILWERRGSRCQVSVPQRGERRKHLDLANKNAQYAFRRHHGRAERTLDMMGDLAERLSLPRWPARIECFDVSNLQGDSIVVGMVVFIDAEPVRRAWRTFLVSRDRQDDYASLREALVRRLRRSQNDDWPLPDLIVIDGGRGQLTAAMEAAAEVGLPGVPLVSIAKERDGKPERLFLPGRNGPLILPRTSPALFLLQRARDAAHEHALDHHRRRRRRAHLRSSLEDIPGVGPKRRRALLAHFGSLRSLKDGSADDIAKVDGISEEMARRIAGHLQAAQS